MEVAHSFGGGVGGGGGGGGVQWTEHCTTVE